MGALTCRWSAAALLCLAYSNEEIAAFERLAGETDMYDRNIFPRIAPQVRFPAPC